MDYTITKIIEAARDLLKEFGYFMDDLWHVDDVNFICEQHNLRKLSKEEAMKVFAIAHEQFDGDHGMSWPQLEKALYIYMRRNVVLVEPEKNEAAK